MAILTGGYYYGYKLTNSVWKYDIMGDKWDEMLPMKNARAQHSCAVVEDSVSKDIKMVVAGGTVHEHSGTNSVEIYNFRNKEWMEGPRLPLAVSLSQLLPDGINGGCILVAGRGFINSHTERLVSIFHLSSRLRQWRMMGRNLNIGRDSHVAMLIPENLIQCSNLDYD